MRRRNWLRALKWAAVAALLTLLFGPALAPENLVKSRIIATVAKATGRRLALDGPLSISLLPWPQFSADRVTLYDPVSSDNGFFLSAERIAARLSLMALVVGRIEFTEIALTKPTVNFRIDEQGRPNWRLRKPPTEAASKQSQAAAAAPAAAVLPPITERGLGPASRAETNAMGGRLTQFAQRIDRILVVDGHVSYRDFDLDGVDLWLSPSDVMAAFMIRGNIVWRGLHRRFSLAVSSLQPVLAGSASPATITISVGSSLLTYSGNAGLAPVLLDGTLALRRIESNAVGRTQPPANIGMLAAAHLVASEAGISLDRLRVRHPDGLQTLEGSLSVIRSGASVAAEGRLDFGRLDLAALLSRTNDSSQSAEDEWPSRDATPMAPRPAKPLPPWPDRPLTLAPLHDVAADVTIDAGPILLPDIRIERTSLHLTAKDGRVALDLAPTQFGSGAVTLHTEAALADTSRVGISISAEARLPAAATSLLRRNPMTGGELKFVLALSTHGASARELTTALAGDFRMVFTGGEFHLARLMRGAREGKIDCPAVVKNNRSSASLRLADGIGPIKLGIDAPPLAIEGTGSLDVPQQRIEFDVRGATASCLRHFALAGPWNDLRYQAAGD
jgi:AsmA protein